MRARSHAEAVLAERALEGVEEPIFYRGERIGSRVKFDARLLLAHLARLDKLCEQDAAAAAEAERFDAALGELAELPEAAVAADPASGAAQVWPARDRFVAMAAEQAALASRKATPDKRAADGAAAGAEAGREWDDWHQALFTAVDRAALGHEVKGLAGVGAGRPARREAARTFAFEPCPPCPVGAARTWQTRLTAVRTG